ncbi:hypothetical protein GCM10010172_86110 [Paractinoplanes ferrugineus]|uniref:Uncharacterized protein n=2 Tax=Paractinoplanes ferrugineus TaxID=113564 RepID=A0A919J643_9ACTN|nr:hypothetical protein Afe05nite_70150 [Actinoplanes ferrugineus]
MPAITGSVGVPTTAPVHIVEDSTTNPWDVAAVTSGVLIGLISLAIAGWALKKSNDAQNAIGAERRRTFELEVLRELIMSFDDNAERWPKIADAPILLDLQFGGRLALLPPYELPQWRKIAKLANVEDVAEAVGIERGKAVKWNVQSDRQFPSPSPELLLALRKAMYDDVISAIERRMNDRDS